MRTSALVLYAASACLVPSLAAAQAAQAGDPGTPLLWLWIVLGIALVSVLVYLLFFSPPARRRGGVRAAARARPQLPRRA